METLNWLAGTLVYSVLPVLCLLHAWRTGREWWWFILILSVPLFGPLLYIFLEIQPLAGLPGRGRLGASLWRDLIPAPWRLPGLRRALEGADTVENRVRLAEALGEAGQWAEASEIYEGCLREPFRDDPFLCLGYARTRFAAGDPIGTLASLDRIDLSGTREKLPDRLLLRARALAATGDPERAEIVFQQALEHASGEEARFQYAAFLESRSRPAEAAALYRQILQDVRWHASLYRRANRPWIQSAKKRLAALPR